MSVEMQAPKLLWLKEVSAQAWGEIAHNSRGFLLGNLSVPGTLLKSAVLDFSSNSQKVEKKKNSQKVDPILLIQ